MNYLFANVAIPVPLQQLFTYSIPIELQPVIMRGSIVVVPFGQKKVNGVVINVTTAHPDFKIKPIIDAADPLMNFDEQQVQLAEWISGYYSAPIGETVKIFLPAGFQQTAKRILALVSPERTNIPLSPKQKKIISALSQKDHLSVAQLQDITGLKNIHSLLNELIMEKVIVSRNQFEKSPGSKKEWYFVTSDGGGETLRGKNQQAAMDALEKCRPQREYRVIDFLKNNAVHLSALKSLAQKNIISLYQKEVIRANEFEYDENARKSLSIALNSFQQHSLGEITGALDGGKHRTFLLHGITGSGKTQVYIEAIRYALSQNRSSIVLIPEISLTPQTVKRFQIHFGDLVVWMHSRMSVTERHNAWKLSKEGKYKIVIGPRSALFAPLQNIGLIIVDEEHESSYKQFDSAPRYNARDVAIVKASLNQSIVVLGSATPSIETYANAQNGKYSLLQLPERADNAVLPPVTMVNMVEERKNIFAQRKVLAKTIGKTAFENLSKSISALLEIKIRERIEKKEKIILLQNRRGFAPFLECADCGYIEQCDRCSVTMTYHAPQKHLRCHYCGKIKHPPTECPQCKGHHFEMRGFGTQRVEEELTALFPLAKILRMDLDTTSRKNSHEKILHKFGNSDIDILLGTQMVAKGLDFPTVTLVGVISADTQMMLPDFRSAERTFQLLTQVAGRAGRSLLQGEVIIQTSQPDHYALKHVKDHDYAGFYAEEIEYRRSLGYPPFSRIILVEFKGVSENNVQSVAEHAGKKISAVLNGAVVLGPTPAVLSKIKNEFRWHIVVKVDKEKDRNAFTARNSISAILQDIQPSAKTSGVKIFIDIDPVGIM